MTIILFSCGLRIQIWILFLLDSDPQHRLIANKVITLQEIGNDYITNMNEEIKESMKVLKKKKKKSKKANKNIKKKTRKTKRKTKDKKKKKTKGKKRKKVAI